MTADMIYCQDNNSMLIKDTISVFGHRLFSLFLSLSFTSTPVLFLRLKESVPKECHVLCLSCLLHCLLFPRGFVFVHESVELNPTFDSCSFDVNKRRHASDMLYPPDFLSWSMKIKERRRE